MTLLQQLEELRRKEIKNGEIYDEDKVTRDGLSTLELIPQILSTLKAQERAIEKMREMEVVNPSGRPEIWKVSGVERGSQIIEEELAKKFNKKPKSKKK